MRSKSEMRTLIQGIRNGPPLQSVVLRRLSHQGATGYELAIRRRNASFMETVAVWLGNEQADFSDIYDEIFDLSYESITQLMGEDNRLF